MFGSSTESIPFFTGILIFTMQRFFITPNAIHDDLVQFPEAIARQMEKVLRLDLMNDEVIVLDNSGNSYLVRLNGRQAGILHGVILQITETNPRTGLKLELGFSLTKREKVEWILQKATELGVSVFRPFVSERSLDRGLTLGNARRERWTAIIREAAEQSHRAKLPELNDPVAFRDALDCFTLDSLRLFAWEGVSPEIQIKPDWFKNASGLSVLVGPEGGFSAEEARMAADAGFRHFSLGRRILRMETACLSVCALGAHYLERAD